MWNLSRLLIQDETHNIMAKSNQQHLGKLVWNNLNHCTSSETKKEGLGTHIHLHYCESTTP